MPRLLFPNAATAASYDAMLGGLDFQICTSSDAPPEGEEWLHQVKHDGWRVFLQVTDEFRLKISTRNGYDYTSEFALPAKGLAELGRPMIIDTEIAAPDETGVTHLDRLNEARSRNRPDLLAFLAFDLLYLDGFDLRRCPIEERLALLEDLIEMVGCPRLNFAGYQIGRGPEFFAEVGAAAKLRGRMVAAKPAEAPRPVVDLMAALKRSLAQESGGTAKPKPRAAADRRQRNLLLPMSGKQQTRARPQPPEAAPIARKKERQR